MPGATCIEPNKESPESARAFWWGLAFWSAVCLIGVVVRGIRWEEGYERAQVLLGITPYPDGHPHAQWYWNGFSIHYYASAALLWLTQSAAVVCGTRQFLAALAVHLPIFGITWLLCRRATAAHFATLLSVVGAITFFQSYMPIAPWANKATSGMMGIGWAFWILAALGAGRWRMAGLLFGLMPLIHLGLWPMVLATTGLWLTWQWALGQRETTRMFIRYALVGLACCALFALIRQPFLIPAPTEGAYTGGRDGHAVWAEYVTYEDMHRAPAPWPRFGPMGNSVMAMAGFLLLALPVAWAEVRQRSTTPRSLLFFTYGLLCVAAIAFAQSVHRSLGVDVPYIVVGWMPNRLTIHLAMLLLCIAVASVFGTQRDHVPSAVWAGLIWLALIPLWPVFVGADLAQRYFSSSEAALFLAAGSALAPLWRTMQDQPRIQRFWGVLVVGGGVVLAGYHQFAAALVFSGLLLSLVDGVMARYGIIRVTYRTCLAALSVLGLVVLFESLWHEAAHREHLPISPFEAKVAQYLDDHSAPGDLVLTPLDERYQMVLDQPVVATFETRQHIGYMPSLASATDKLYADLYGVKDGKWYDWGLWMRRSEADWQALGEAYGFRYVLINDFYPLHLPRCIEGDGLVLYEVPHASQ